MKFIYIENFTQLHAKEQKEFSIFMSKTNCLKNVLQKEIILSEESLLLGFFKKDIDKAFQYLNQYFTSKEYNFIILSIVRKTLDSNNKLILKYENEQNKIIIGA
jgi:hypothetical protein